MKVSAWKNGSYGIRVEIADRTSYFKSGWADVEIEIGGVQHQFPICPKFWSDCPEIRGEAFGTWFASKGLIPWSKGKPPQFDLIPIAGNKFELI